MGSETSIDDGSQALAGAMYANLVWRTAPVREPVRSKDIREELGHLNRRGPPMVT